MRASRDPPMTVTPIDTKQREHREATLRGLLEAQNRHDVEASLACFAHPRYELVGNQRVYDGTEDVRRYYATTFGAFPDIASSSSPPTTPTRRSSSRCG